MPSWSIVSPMPSGRRGRRWRPTRRGGGTSSMKNGLPGLVVYGARQLGLRLTARAGTDQGLHGAFVEPLEGEPLELVLLSVQVGEGLGEMVGRVLLRLR